MSAAKIVLVGGPDPSAAILGLRIAGDGSVEAMAPLAPRAGGDPQDVILIIPGADVRVRRFDIPAVSEAQARAAAQLMFEGALAQSTDDMHYAIGESVNDQGARLVAVIATTRLQAWIDACHAVGFEPVQVFADFTLWPTPEGAADIVQVGDLTLVAGGATGGYAIESALAPSLFRRWLADSNGAIRRFRMAPGPDGAWRQALSGLDVEPLENAGHPQHVLARAAAAGSSQAPDLRQGRFALKSAEGGGWRFWRLALAFLFLVFLVQTGAQIVSGMRDKRAAVATLELAERDFRAARPDIGRIVNLRAQVAAIRNEIAHSGAHPVLALNARLIPALEAHPLVRLEEVRHAEPGRRVSLVLSASDAGALDAFVASLSERNLKAEVRERRPEAGRHLVELIVEAP